MDACRTHANKFSAGGGAARLSKDKPNALGIVSATYPANAKPVLTLSSHVSLKNYAVDLSAPDKAPHVSKGELDYYLQPSRYVPTGGIVKQTALKATAGATTEMEKAQGDLRRGGGQHLPRSEGPRQRARRHSLHAGVGRYGREMRRLECPLCWPGTLRRPAGAACLWFAGC